MRNIRKDEKGYIVVETIGSFMLFTLVIASIVTMINVVIVQARIHYAITQTANELAMYSYVVHASGIEDSELLENLDNVVEIIYGFSQAIGNPADILQSGLVSAAFYGVAGNILERHLAIGGMDADTYLQNNNVVGGFRGISLYDSTFIDDNGNITIVAAYRINFAHGLGGLPLPEQFRSLPVSQTAMTRAWRGGIPYE